MTTVFIKLCAKAPIQTMFGSKDTSPALRARLQAQAPATATTAAPATSMAREQHVTTKPPAKAASKSKRQATNKSYQEATNTKSQDHARGPDASECAEGTPDEHLDAMYELLDSLAVSL
jgi:hypothetical protein